MRKSTITAIAVAVGLALQLVKPNKTGKKKHMRSSSVKKVSQSPLSDILTLRKRARHRIEGGAVTSGYAADRETVLRLLNEAFTTEIA
jgi:hypothetical protein